MWLPTGQPSGTPHAQAGASTPLARTPGLAGALGEGMVCTKRGRTHPAGRCHIGIAGSPSAPTADESAPGELSEWPRRQSTNRHCWTSWCRLPVLRDRCGWPHCTLRRRVFCLSRYGTSCTDPQVEGWGERLTGTDAAPTGQLSWPLLRATGRDRGRARVLPAARRRLRRCRVAGPRHRGRSHGCLQMSC